MERLDAPGGLLRGDKSAKSYVLSVAEFGVQDGHLAGGRRRGAAAADKDCQPDAGDVEKGRGGRREELGETHGVEPYFGQRPTRPRPGGMRQSPLWPKTSRQCGSRPGLPSARRYRSQIC